MKRPAWLIGLAAALAAGFLPLHADGECFTIVVGRLASVDGAVLVAHNEDDRGRQLVDVHKLPPRSWPAGAQAPLNGGAMLPQVAETPGLLWLEMPGQEFADAWFSERGVIVTSNACNSREDRDDASEGGIGYMLRRLVAERAGSAAEGVRIAGALIEAYGYNGSGRTYTIADPREAWLLAVVRGRRWAAKRVPDDTVAVLANRFTVDGADPDDPGGFLASADVEAYATGRGWHDPVRDGAFRFERAYSAPDTRSSPANVLRQWRGTARLSGKPWRETDPLPFSFRPARKLGVADLMAVLRDHYEGTTHDASQGYRRGSPNRTDVRTICTESTQLAWVAQLRAAVAPELQTLVWICFRRPDSNGFAPWYASMPAIPDGYEHRPPWHQLAEHYAPGWEAWLERRDRPFAAFARLSALVDERYAERIDDVRRQWRYFEDALFRRLPVQEREFVQLLRTSRPVAVRLIGTFTADCEYRKWLMTEKLAARFEN